MRIIFRFSIVVNNVKIIKNKKRFDVIASLLNVAS